MGKSARRDPQGGRPGRGRRGSTRTDPELERLGQRFAQFRREHPPQTRIPLPLREAVLAVTQRGATATQLRRACGVSPSQLDLWQKGRGKRARAAAPRQPAPRVFAVVPDAPSEVAKSADRRAMPELELRLGGWSIRVRPVDA